MAIVKSTDDPKITDTIEIDFVTTDENGNKINPYSVNTITIYFIERDFAVDVAQYKQVTEEIDDVSSSMFYTNAIPVYTLGSTTEPAWLSTDTSDAVITKNNNDEDGNVLIGNFTATWVPDSAKEGDYFVCYTWTPLVASAKITAHQSFFVFGDTASTTALPTHQTVDGKYETLLNNYLPETYHLKLADLDVTPDVMERFHGAVAKGFTTVEDLANQLIDLLDANVCNETYLPYLANLFRLKLRSTDTVLWRRQIKTAMQMYKKKGTLQGLKDALSSAGIVFQGLTQYYQVVSKATWQDGFVITDEDQVSFTLTKLAILPVDTNNFELYIRYEGSDEYVSISLDYVTFGNSNGVTTMVWIPDGVVGSVLNLVKDDVIKVVYKVKEPTSQSVENYIRSLPLADKRDELLVDNPKKNWNVRLISTDDVMFSTIVSTTHPFSPLTVWGNVRTEFAYSENAYNMDEYNGSFRDSNYQCDIDESFVDHCSNCLGSIISVDLEIDNLNNDRIVEASEIVKDFIPFHAQIDSINYTGAINEYFVPPTEDLEMLLFMSFNENILIGQSDFTRIIPVLNETTNEIRRNMLSNSSTAVPAESGTAYNDEIVLFAPDFRLDTLDIDTNSSQTLLHILNGANAGSYNVTTPNQHTVKIVQGSPDSIPYPLNSTAFTFNLSNEITSDLSADIYQDDIYAFTESSQDFIVLNLTTEVSGGSPAKLVVTSGAYAGAYVIHDVLPDNTILINSFPSTSNVSGLFYKITNNDQSTTYLNRSTNGSGNVGVTRRGRVETVNLRDDWGVTNGYFVRYSSADYKITGFSDASTAYIDGYVGGTVAGVPIKIYKRLIEQGTGYVDVRGMYLITSTNYEAGLDVQNGSNPPATPLENDSFIENFLVVINGNYYQIIGWNGTRIDISGPKTTWGLSGTTVTFSIMQYDNVSPFDVVSPYDGETVEFQRIDRRGNEPVNITTESVSMSMSQMMTLGSSLLNSGSGSQIVEQINTDEFIGFEIEWLDGSYTEGQI